MRILLPPTSRRPALLLGALLLFSACAHEPPAPDLARISGTAADAVAVPSARAPAGAFDPLEGLRPAPDELSLAKLTEILERQRYHRIEDLLAHLAGEKDPRDNYRDYLSRHTLAFASRSLHSSSDEAPRAIVFGKTANFIITFNEDPKHESHRMLEVAEFNHAQAAFEFREIEFNETNEPGHPPFRISAPGGPRDPQTFPGGKCLQCHAESRPLWENYPVWPGLFGGDDDSPFRVPAYSEENTKGPRMLRNLKVPEPPSVAARWKKFANRAALSPRYRHLGAMSTDNSLVGAGTAQDYHDNPEARLPMPNASLTRGLGLHNQKRMAAILSRVKLTEPEIYTLLGYLQPVIAGMALRESPVRLGPLAEAVRVLRKEAEGHVTGNLRLLFRDIQPDYRNARIYERGQYHKVRNFEEFLAFQGASPTSLELIPFFAFLEKHHPEAQPRTWPSNLYEGIYLFSDGSVPEQKIARQFARVLIAKLPAADQDFARRCFVDGSEAPDDARRARASILPEYRAP